MRTFKDKQGSPAVRNQDAGFTMIEMLIASVILVVGLLAATVLAQMTIETIAAVSANATTSMTIVDCNPTTSSASHSISTTGSSSGSGAPLSSGSIDFTQATVSGYAMTYYGCQSSTSDRQMTYDVRWNIKTLTTNTKLVTVSARPVVSVTGGKFLSVPVNLKMIVGL
jgi:prepilin-type N-terminal cleavage/methylation domain-containing protein